MATVDWDGSALRLLDQTRIPDAETYVTCRTAAEVADAISRMVVRGAPAIGAAAGHGVALEAAHAIASQSIDGCRRMGAFGAALLPEDAHVVTICNTGALATVDYGTALGVVRVAHEAGKRPFVYVMETRPRAQGARLTTWELGRLGIPHALIADSAAGRLIQCGEIDVALTGADRICANGDVVNKVGTYPLALLARAHGIDFLVAAPLSTIDMGAADGSAVEIEERQPAEVTTFAPPGTPARNPAFDVTFAALVSAIITDRGVVEPPYPGAIAGLMAAAA